MKNPTDRDIVNWIEINIADLLVSRSYPFDYNQSYSKEGKPKRELVFQRKIRVGKCGQNIWSEREYQSLREMATDALLRKNI
jgi:hypothetical protein